ncbi:luciferin 4-monooxygenase-like [Tenebrio molitor]|uniref:luciferin 4-monooxygenase-like n=1 Tax=Tenebrio molitor TaxID=7067 RepID=UPI0036247D25
MSDLVKMGPLDNQELPKKSLGAIFFEKIKKWDANRVAIVDWTGEELNYGHLLQSTVKLATQMTKLGVKKGDVITILSPNSTKFILTVLAGFYVGAKVNLLNPDYTLGELKHFCEVCHPVLIFCTAKSLENVFELRNCVSVDIILYDTETVDDVENFDKLIEACTFDPGFSPTKLDPKEDVALILTSSGTTGFPKSVQLTHASLRVTMLYSGDPYFLDVNENERILSFLPFFHMFGIGITLAGILYGAKLVILEKFVPDRFLSLIQKHRITKLYAVPPILLFLVKSPLVQKYDLSSITDVLCGAATVTKETEDLVEAQLNIHCVRQIYGMTEVSGGATVIPKNLKKPGSSGQVVTGHQIKICDPESGKALGVNEVGELRIKGDGVMKGYLSKEIETEEAFDEEGFFKSGDLGYYDDEGFFFIVDRLKEIIKYKGFQVSPAELESLLIQHPAVKDAGVIGIPDEKAGELPVAFVVKQPNQDVTEEEIVCYIAENVSVQKRLSGGVRFIEEIPKSSSGKILRKKLKELL